MSDIRPFIQAVAAAAAGGSLPSGVKAWRFEVSDVSYPFGRFYWVDATGKLQSLPVQVGKGRPQDWSKLPGGAMSGPNYPTPPILTAVKGENLPPGAPVHQEADGTLRLAAEGEHVCGFILTPEEIAHSKAGDPPAGYSHAAVYLHRARAAVWHR